MTNKPDPAADLPPGRGKSDVDDHDLLTFGEAGERLRSEIAAAERTVDQLQSASAGADVEKAQARLDALRSAAHRNSAQPINDENFEKFFGYPGKATRNLPSVGQSG